MSNTNDFVVFNEDAINVEHIGQGVLKVAFTADHDPIEFLIGEVQANVLASIIQSTLMDLDIARGDRPSGADDERPLREEWERPDHPSMIEFASDDQAYADEPF